MSRSRRSGWIGRILIAAVIAIASLVTYFSSSQENPVTGETQYVDLTVKQEIALGLEAAPKMADKFGGLDPSERTQSTVDRIGQEIVAESPAGESPYEFEFHVLADRETVNAFALPGGQIFITRALYDKLDTRELAAVLGHEVAHVIARHSSEQIAKAKLTEGLTGAAVVATYDPDNPSSRQAAQMAAVIGQLINLKYSRDDELESDRLGVCFMEDAGYNPQGMREVMEVLASARQGQAPPEFLSTHPNPENRFEQIEEAIRNLEDCP